MSLSHRERVQLALSRRQPDRTPVDMMGNASMLLDPTYLRLRDYLGLAPIPPVRSGTTANYYDERILEHFGVDFRRVFLAKGSGSTILQHDDDSFTDAWGVRSRNVGIFVSAVEYPLRHAATLDDVETYPWPTAAGLHSAAGVRDAAYRLYHESDYAVVARNPLSLGFLDRGCSLMGIAEFLMLMIDAPAVADAILDRILEIYMGVYRIFLEAAGPYVQMVEVADDLGGARNPLVSPAMYRRFIKPREQKLYAMIRELAPDAFIIHHTDGNVFALIPDLIEVGVERAQPGADVVTRHGRGAAQGCVRRPPGVSRRGRGHGRGQGRARRRGEGAHRRVGQGRRLRAGLVQPHDRRRTGKRRGDVRDCGELSALGGGAAMKPANHCFTCDGSPHTPMPFRPRQAKIRHLSPW